MDTFRDLSTTVTVVCEGHLARERFTDLPTAVTLDTRSMAWLTSQGQTGIWFAGDNVRPGLNRTLQTGAHTTNHGMSVAFRYEAPFVLPEASPQPPPVTTSGGG